jgi:hypothetical protein
MRNGRWLAVTLLCGFAAAPAVADDIRPESRPLAEAIPMADEKCIEQCDLASDQCMQAAEGDPGKMQACDDQYGACLQKCETG